MKRSEFNYECENNWGVDDLINFAYDENLESVTDNIYTEDALNDYMDEYVRNCTDHWQVLLDTLSSISTGYDYYYRADYDDSYFRPIYGDDFEEIKERIECAMDGYWDEEEEEIDGEYYDYSQINETCENDSIPDAPEFDAVQLFSSCSGALQIMHEEDNTACAERYSEEQFLAKVSVDIELNF